MDAPVSAKAALLQVLLKEPGHGFALIDRVRERTQGRLVLSEGSAYPALRDLERERMVDGREEAPPADRGGRPRRVYTITDLGRRFAEDQREQVAGLCGLGKPTKRGKATR